MTKEEFKAVEKKLYDYYQKERIINSLKFKLNLVEDQLKAIEEKIAGNKVNIEGDGLKAINYCEKIQTTSTGTSYAEQALIREIECLEKECIRKKEIKNKLEENLRDIELDNGILEYNINFLSERDKKLLEEKYKNTTPDWEIAQDINTCETNIRKIRKKLLNEVNKWLS